VTGLAVAKKSENDVAKHSDSPVKDRPWRPQ
jgi:hypothetical protein